LIRDNSQKLRIARSKFWVPVEEPNEPFIGKIRTRVAPKTPTTRPINRPTPVRGLPSQNRHRHYPSDHSTFRSPRPDAIHVIATFRYPRPDAIHVIRCFDNLKWINDMSLAARPSDVLVALTDVRHVIIHLNKQRSSHLNIRLARQCSP
jgi:hypothetical protein